jgi:DNA-binding CsgD family transcriptional regulator
MNSVAQVIRDKARKDILGKVLLELLALQKDAKKKARRKEFAGVKRLTSRQIQITKLLLEGFSYTEVANVLDISANTVRSHCRRIYLILGIRGRKELNSGLSSAEVAYVCEMNDNPPK